MKHLEFWVINQRNKFKNFGKKTKMPTMAAPMAVRSTAPAAKSLACPAKGCGFGDTKSVKSSSEVLNASAASTVQMAIIIKHHSVVLI